ncbi:hypothetical protein AAC387_Pa01g4292 [Persea americana]
MRLLSPPGFVSIVLFRVTLCRPPPFPSPISVLFYFSPRLFLGVSQFCLFYLLILSNPPNLYSATIQKTLPRYRSTSPLLSSSTSPPAVAGSNDHSKAASSVY